jgi:hypothetical protein
MHPPFTKNWSFLLILSLALAFSFGCSDDPTDPGGGGGGGSQSQADSIATSWMDDLGDRLQVDTDNIDPEDFEGLEYTDVRTSSRSTTASGSGTSSMLWKTPRYRLLPRLWARRAS